MDEIINYRDLSDEEKNKALSQLIEIGAFPACSGFESIKQEMDKSTDIILPQYILVRRKSRLIGYMFLIAEKEDSSRTFPWWAADNSDELPLETDIRLLQYGIELCVKAGCFQLADRLRIQSANHQKYIGRRPEELSR